MYTPSCIPGAIPRRDDAVPFSARSALAIWRNSHGRSDNPTFGKGFQITVRFAVCDIVRTAHWRKSESESKSQPYSLATDALSRLHTATFDRASDLSLRATPVSRPRTEIVSGQKRARAQNRAPGLELVHDLCVRARSLDTFPLDVERALDKIPLKKQVP